MEKSASRRRWARSLQGVTAKCLFLLSTLVTVFFIILFAYYSHYSYDGYWSNEAIPPTVPRGDLHKTWRWHSYLSLGRQKASSILPGDKSITLTNAEHVTRRGASVQKLFSCYGNRKNANISSSKDKNYDFVILPIGCFGDVLSDCVSCTLSKTLVNATYCGRRKLGLFLGDNFYPYGIRSFREPRFHRDLHKKFLQFPELRIQYYATSGNHDERPRFLYRNKPHWKFPSPYYNTGVLQSGETTIEIFVFSTNPYEIRTSQRFHVKQAKWLDRVLTNSTAHWKIVMTHEPIFDFVNLKHFPRSTGYIHPLLKKHKVSLLVCAHLHGVFLHGVDGGYYQLISAGFVSNLATSMHSERPLGYNHLGNGATALLVNHNDITVLAADAKGHLIFQHKIPHRMAT
ncbi:Calcineurin-like phosphoesterase domain [Trypanosoma melophagium]|uniref:Calcineurin-like phosphoesterase domain n=1 Tax=Trypanosoma melophagium TaxID=715481 RepID=UPI00351A7F16|nr:Calcineurin-like phosphoesterase domain [Trypanosoma melophagium]